MNLISTRELQKAMGAEGLWVSLRRVNELLRTGRIVGAQKVGGRWVIPDSWEINPPIDGGKQLPQKRFCITSGRTIDTFNAASLRVANSRNPEFCAWLRSAAVGDTWNKHPGVVVTRVS